jgi:CBS domain-containing protein
MKKVKDILTRKGGNITTVTPQTPVLDALAIMANQNIGSVMVMEGDQYLGIMTERDYSRKVALKGRSSTDTQVSEIMSTDYPRIKLMDTMEQCMQLMSEKNIRYLPVFEGDTPCGIISINDVVKETIITQQETISQLKDYLHASL